MSATAAVLSLVLAVISLGAGLPKVALKGMPVKNLRPHGFDDARIRFIGVAELAAAVGLVVGLWYPILGLAAAVGMTLLLIGAVAYHFSWGDFANWATARASAVPAVVCVLLAAATTAAIAMTGL